VYQISSKLGHKWRAYGISMIFEMAAADIFENGGTLPVMRFLD
jgi:hypothetical protein